MVHTVFISLGILAAAFAAPAAQLTAEIPVSTPQYGPAAGDQTMPIVATNGSDFLVAWVDARSYPAVIYANRVTADGRVLDGTGLRIPADGSPQIIGLHFIGGAYTLVYWYSTLESGVVSMHTGVAIIGADGKLIEGPHAILDDEAVRQSASNGSRIVFPTAHDFVAIDARGNVLARYPMPAQAYTVASNGTTFLAVGFTQNGSTWGEDLIALDTNGRPGNASHVDNISLGYGPFIASDGSDYLVVYTGPLASTSIAQRVSDNAQIESTINAAGGFPALTLAWTGATYTGIAWTADQTQTALVTFAPDGAQRAAPRIVGSGSPGVAAWNGTEMLLTWITGSHGAPYGFDIAGVFASADATPTSSVMTIPKSAHAQRNAAIATSGSHDLVAWAEPSGIFATRVTAAGVPLDGRGIAVASEDMTSFTYLASPGFKNVCAIDDGTTYIVAWGSNRTWGTDGLLTGPVKAQRIAHSGALVGDTIELSPCCRTFDLEMGPDGPVLFQTPCSGVGLVAQRIGGPAVLISSMSTADNPRAVCNGGEWLVVWNNLIESGLTIYPPVFTGEVYAARFSATLGVLDPQPVAIDATESGSTGAPFVATDGHDFLVVWSATHFGRSSGLFSRTVHADGSLSNAELLVEGSVEAKSVAFDGRQYAIAYATSDLFLTHPGAHDQVVISATPNAEFDAALIAPRGRPLRVVYTRVALEPDYGGVPRLFVRDEILPKRRALRLATLPRPRETQSEENVRRHIRRDRQICQQRESHLRRRSYGLLVENGARAFDQFSLGADARRISALQRLRSCRSRCSLSIATVSSLKTLPFEYRNVAGVSWRIIDVPTRSSFHRLLRDYFVSSVGVRLCRATPN